MPFTPPKPIAPTPEELRGSTVLVVDDERAWRVILETDLKMLGYKVSIAEDADQALIRAQADKPEVAIIDLMLPEPMDGWGLLNELRARGQKVPVIFYTAYPVFPSGTDDPDVVGYMSKAVDRADLYALLPGARSACRRSRPASRSTVPPTFSARRSWWSRTRRRCCSNCASTSTISVTGHRLPPRLPKHATCSSTSASPRCCWTSCSTSGRTLDSSC